MNNNVLTSQYHLYDYERENLVVLIVYNSSLANKVNKQLDYYKDVRIEKGEEPMFKINRRQFDSLRTMTAFKHITLK